MDARNPLVHEAESQRQHLRVSLPITARIDGVTRTVTNWSVGGMCVLLDGPRPQPGDVFEAELIFPTEGIEITTRLTCEVVHNEGKLGGTGCRFVELSPGSLSILQYMIGAYVSGELVQLGDVLSILKRDNFTQRRKPRASEGPTRAARVLVPLKRAAKISVLAASGIALVLYVAAAIYKRLYIVDMVGYVGSPATIFVRATSDGVVTEFPPLERGARVGRGQVLGQLEDPEGTPRPLISPCDCVAVANTAPVGSVLQRGAPVVVLAPENSEVTVVAQVSVEESAAIQEGDPSHLTMFNGRSEMEGTVISMQRFTPIEYSTERGAPTLKSYVILVIRPHGELTLQDYAEPVRVRINTFWNEISEDAWRLVPLEAIETESATR
ncbi:MAG: HlyD family efflux transporter periplasmic adaptor subunit [Propylenella sp.]